MLTTATCSHEQRPHPRKHGQAAHAMRKQKDLDGKTELNLAPAYLIVPSELEQTAYQLTSSNYVPAKARPT